MNAIAKVFIVLNFVLSVFFVGVASTLLYKADNFRTRFEDEALAHTKTKSDRAAEIAKLNAELGTAQTSVDAATRSTQEATRDRDALRTEKTELETARAQLQNTVAGFETSLRDLQASLQAARETNEQLKKSTDEAVAAQNTAADKQAEAEAEVTRKDDALRDAGEQIAALEKQLTEAGEKIKTHETTMAMLESRGIDPASLMGPPAINGTVVSSNDALRYCIISVGHDDGVKIGFPFKIFRGGSFVGDGVVSEVFPDLSSIRIKMLAPGMTVQPNDQVTTQLNPGVEEIRVMAKKVTKTRVEEEDVDDVDGDDGAPSGDPLATAILVVTTLCLVIAIAISWWQLGRDYKAGMFGG